MNFKNIYIGKLIKLRVEELGLNEDRISNFFKLPLIEIEAMYEEQDLSTEYLMRWSKLLEYDFFRIYSQHIILYAPSTVANNTKTKKSSLPQFRKNVYTKEIIDFILELIVTNKMTKDEVIIKYRIPKTTLYKWIIKYKKK